MAFRVSHHNNAGLSVVSYIWAICQQLPSRPLQLMYAVLLRVLTAKWHSVKLLVGHFTVSVEIYGTFGEGLHSLKQGPAL